MGVQQLSQPPVWSSLPSCLDSLPFTPVFVPKAGSGNFVGSGVVVVRLPPHVPKSLVSPSSPSEVVRASGNIVRGSRCPVRVCKPASAFTDCLSPLILGSLPFPSLSPVWSYILLFSALPMKRKGIVARSTVSDRPK